MWMLIGHIELLRERIEHLSADQGYAGLCQGIADRGGTADRRLPIADWEEQTGHPGCEDAMAGGVRKIGN